MRKLILFMSAFLLLFAWGCTKNDNASDSKGSNDPGIEKLFEAAKQNMDTEIMTEESDPETINTFFEITKDNYEEFKFAMPNTNIQVSQIVIVKAKDGNLDAVKKGIKSYLDNNLEIFSSYLPDQYELLKKAEFFEKDNYSILLVGEGADKAKDAVLNAFK